MLASLVVVGVGGYVVHGYQVNRNATALLSRAEDAQAKGEFGLASSYFERYLGFVPTDGDALIRYGLLRSDPAFAKTPRDMYRAMLVLEKVLYREPERHDLRRRIVHMSLDLDLFANAEADLVNYLKPAFPNDGELHELHGRCLEGKGKYREARGEYELAIAHAPSRVEAYRRLVRILRRRSADVLRAKETPNEVAKKADAVVDAAVRANPQSAEAYLLRAEYRHAYAPGGANAAEDVARARQLAPNAPEVLEAVADEARRKGDTETARKVLRTNQELHPDDWRAYRSLAFAESAAGRTDEALAALRAGLNRMPQQPELLWQYADQLIGAGRRAEVEPVITQLEKVGVPQAERDMFRARILAESGEWLRAARLLDQIVPTLSARAGAADDTFAARLATQGGLLHGQCYERLGDFDHAAAAYGRAVARDATSIVGRCGAARALAALGRHAEAVEQYRQLVKTVDPPPEVWLEYAQLALARNRQRESGGATNWTEVEHALSKASAGAQPLPAAVAARAEMLAARNQAPAARDAILATYPDAARRPSDAWVALAAVETAQGRDGAANAVLAEAFRHHPDAVDLRLARGRLLIRSAPPQVAEELAKLSATTNLSPVDRQRLLRELAMLANVANQPALAIDLLQLLAKDTPNDVYCWIGMFEAAARSNNGPLMQESVSNLRRIEGPDGVMWRFARANLLLDGVIRGDHSGAAEARTLLGEVAARRPNWHRVAVCEGRLDEAEGRSDAALAAYQRALKVAPAELFALGRAVSLLTEQRRYSAAYDLLRPSINDAGLPADLRKLGVELALRNRDTAGAARLAEGVLANHSREPRDHLLLAKLAMATGKPDAALASLTTARDLAPGDPNVWLELVRHLAMTNQKDRAAAECEAAKKSLAGHAGQVGVARCLEAAGRTDAARELYEAAMAASGGDPAVVQGFSEFLMRSGKTRDAEPHLRRLAAGGAPADITAWARRNLSLVTALRGDAGQSREAMALLSAEAGPAARPSEAADRRTRATILAMRPIPQSRREALKILESLIERKEALAEDLFLAAHLHESLGDWPRAKLRFQDLLRLTGGDSPAHLSFCARALLRHGEAGPARPLVQRLAEMEPDAFVTVELAARLLHADNKAADAVRLLRGFAQKPDAPLAQVASLLAELDARPAAEELYRRLAGRSDRPADAVPLAQFLVNGRRYAEALDVCERAWGEAPPLELADVAVAAVSEASPPDPALLARLERRVEGSLQRVPDSVGMLASLAAVRNFQGRFDESEQLYRRALAREPKLVVALNNLAWLLVLRSGRAAEALDLLRRAAEITGEDPSLLDTRGVAYLTLRQGDALERAAQDLETVTAALPNPASFFHLAQAYLAAGRRRDADQAWRRAKSLGLNAAVLHPLERPAFVQMAKELK